MEGTLTLLEAHDISDEVEAKIRAAFPNAEGGVGHIGGMKVFSFEEFTAYRNLA